MKLLLTLRELLPNLSTSELRVARYVLEHPADVTGLPIAELAGRCGTSNSSVVRLCKEVGCDGYKNFCMMLHTELMLSEPVTYTDIDVGSDTKSTLAHVAGNVQNTVKNTLEVLDPAEIDRVAELLHLAPRIDFYGVGNSGFAALDAQNKFMRIGKTAIALTDPHLQVLNACTLTPGDAAVFISYSGTTRDVCSCAELAAASGACCIAVTRYGKNPLAALCAHQLCTVSDEGLIRSGAMSSRIGLLTVLDMLFSVMTAKHYAAYKPFLDRSGEVAVRKKDGH